MPKSSIKFLKNTHYFNMSDNTHKTSTFPTKINIFCGSCSLLGTIFSYFGSFWMLKYAPFLFIFTIKLIIFHSKSIVSRGNLFRITNLVDIPQKSYYWSIYIQNNLNCNMKKHEKSFFQHSGDLLGENDTKSLSLSPAWDCHLIFPIRWYNQPNCLYFVM